MLNLQRGGGAQPGAARGPGAHCRIPAASSVNSVIYPKQLFQNAAFRSEPRSSALVPDGRLLKGITWESIREAAAEFGRFRGDKSAQS